MTKIITLICVAILCSVASFALTPITGPSGACLGATVTLHDTTAGGTWASSNTAVATIGTAGIYSAPVTGVGLGTATITYTVGGVAVTSLFTVAGTTPAPISGTMSMCVGATSTLTDATPGGTWSSASGYYATVGLTTGIVTGVHGGSETIYYTVGSGCDVSAVVTVTPPPTVLITGYSTVCAGSTITLSDSLGYGGAWSSSVTTVATVGTMGIVIGLAVGTTTISYTVTGACGTTVGTKVITVSSSTSAGSITGASSVVVGASTTLFDGVSGGTWSSSNTSIATVDASGVLTGVAAGVATISYTVIGCGGSAYTTAPMTVTAFSGISGHILFTHGGHYGSDSIKVWLINYNPGTLMLEAVDSVALYTTPGATSVYYQFSTAATDSFRIKAAPNDTGAVGYIPTYETSSFYWNTATVLYHTSGVGDVNQDITMLYGTITPGPGFIAGNVMSGANKGTVTTIPSAGLKMYCIDGSGAIVQQTTTDASGNYKFSSLPYGTYTVFPEALNYLTTAYTSITLTSSSPSMAAASFLQHSVSLTITPILITGVKNITSEVASVFTYPNPTTGKLNIQWQEPTAEKATVAISDITGREIYTSSIDMNKGTGNNQIDLSNLNNGLYMISIKSAAINYNSKVQVQK